MKILGQLIVLLLFTISVSAQQKVEFTVGGACGMCKETIEETALGFNYVKTAEWNQDTKILKLSVKNDSNGDEIQRKLAEIGHDTQKYKATDQAYDELPMCCHYRDPENHNHVDFLHGVVYEKDFNGKKVPLEGAAVYWEGTTVGAVAGKGGTFIIKKVKSTNVLNMSFVGYESAKVKVNKEDYVLFIFDSNKMLEEVVVTYRKDPTTISFLKTLKVQELNEKELQKAACCNLSESFETNPSVDVSSTDAVTGTKQIELLGLAGSYVQITRENMPDTRALSTLFGLTYTPGSWIESIQLNTGTGSVVNGYEGITGQINVELKKPQNGQKLFLNSYFNQMGRAEMNANFAFDLSKALSTGFLLHYSTGQKRWDHNNDGILDAPIGDNFVAMNRWQYHGESGLEAQLGFKVVSAGNLAGEKGYTKNSTGLWGSHNQTDRYEIWSKVGQLIDDRSSVGLQMSILTHKQDANYGSRVYNATQNSAYANLIYQNQLSESNEIKTGLSFVYDNIDEQVESANYLRDEKVIGAFAEYTYKHEDKFTAVLGARADNHSNYGLFITPRLHLRYAFEEKSVLRASVGRGQKTASIFAENIGAFASNRVFVVKGDGSDKPYGLEAEVSWNYGISFSQGFELFQKEVIFNVDYYLTDFQNQIVVDYDNNAQEVSFYNLNGNSFSKSFQAQFDVNLSEAFSARIAYRFNDVRTNFSGIERQKPLVARHRAFINLAYETQSKWKFDYTANWIGPKRLPITGTNPIGYRFADDSPSYFLMNAQISKTMLSDKLDVYLGVENALNYRQKDAIISADNTSSPYFDASMIWGPVFGRNIYLGARYNL